MALINSPPYGAVDEVARDGRIAVSSGWRNFFVAVFNLLTALTQSGTTAQRPTQFCWIGRTYFDVTLGIPIWVQSLAPIVWINAAGAVV